MEESAESARQVSVRGYGTNVVAETSAGEVNSDLGDINSASNSGDAGRYIRPLCTT